MPLPDLIAIEPLAGPVRAEVTVPGSKSVTNRAMVLAALASGTTTLRGALWSEDTQLMAQALRRLGFAVEVAPDPDESSNRTIVVEGRGGSVPPGGSVAQPLDLDVGNAGTAARFLAALVCLGAGVYRLDGSARMHERPQAGLFDALRELGYRIDAPNDRLPARIHGGGMRPGSCRVRIDQSSQFASALLLSARAGGWTVQVEGESAEEAPYVRMTRELVGLFPPRAAVSAPSRPTLRAGVISGPSTRWARSNTLNPIASASPGGRPPDGRSMNAFHTASPCLPDCRARATWATAS